MIYLDYAASTPVDKEVLDAYYNSTLKYFANPNSNHVLGKKAMDIINDCTINIAKNLKVLPEEIIYTSGATEANNLAIMGICERYKNFGKHIILSSLEHNSIIAPATVMQEKGFEIDLVPISKNGTIDIEKLKSLIRPDTILVSVCAVDSELGIIEPIEEIGKLLRAYPDTYFHTDASQAIGKVNIDFTNVDLVTIAPHKFYGINGAGLLIKKQNVELKPIIYGGRSLSSYRSGTPVLANIVAIDKALELALKYQEERYSYVLNLQQRVIDFLKQYNFIHLNNKMSLNPYIINFSIKTVKADQLVKMLEEKEIYVSPKTSCCPVQTPSKLVYALTKDKALASSAIRVSLSHLTTEKDIEVFLEALSNIIKELKENGKI